MNDEPEQNGSKGESEATAVRTGVKGEGRQLILDETWLHDFYKECGREATLAYTTLNQMKNWAMVVAAAALSGLPFSSRATEYPTPMMFAGIVIVYTFILRFFVRAILCYINLVRWNVLQSDCVELRLVRITIRPASTAEPEEAKFLRDLQAYYFEWLSPLCRKDQLFQNLKLGFYLLFGLAFFFMIWGAAVLWQSYFVRGLVTFAVLNTLLETYDFFSSKYFDNVAAHERRNGRRKMRNVFPIPHSRGAFFAGWALNVVLSSLVALWPTIRYAISHLFHS
jgi:hypothetical protein